jgi:hypothetical protein
MSNSSGGYDKDTHYLLSIHEPPASLVALRIELVKHPDIYLAAQKSSTFEESLAIIGEKLDIVLDGDYDVEPLCAMLVDCLRKRGRHKDSPHLRHASLIDAEIIETEKGITLATRDRGVSTELPPGSVLTETAEPILSNQPAPSIELASTFDTSGYKAPHTKTPGPSNEPGDVGSSVTE